MPIDGYSLCPGGTGKKIKFCCSDFLPELDKIDRMIEGEQYLACLQQVERLLAHEPGRDRQCLLATQCMLLRATHQHEAAQAVAEKFLAKYPDNQVALAESAIVEVEKDPHAAYGLLQRAMRAAQGNLSARTYQAAEIVATVLAQAGDVLPAHALLELLADAASGNRRIEELLYRLEQAASLPLLLRDEPPLAPAPEGAPWKKRLDKAMEPFEVADWLTAVERLSALAGEVPDAAAVWRNLAIIRGWIVDYSGATEAWRKYASLRAGEDGGLEDAAEAEAIAMFLSDDPLGDRIDSMKLVWTVNNQERAQEGLLSSPQLTSIPFDPARFTDGETPPPKNAFLMLDRPVVESAEGLTAETMPRVLGYAMLFGKQTDREARLEMMGIPADDLSTITDVLRRAVGESIDPEPQQEVVGKLSASWKLLHPAWRPPRDTTEDQLHQLTVTHLREAVLHRWPEMKLGALDGRSPREAAADPASRPRVLGVIIVLEQWADRLPMDAPLAELRQQLGLPVPGPIDPQAQPLEMLSPLRLARLEIEKLSDDQLQAVYDRARAFADRPAVQKFGQAIIDRPSFAQSDMRLHAFATLARLEQHIPQALKYVDEGRRSAEARKMSSATWDLLELSIRFAERNGEAAGRLIDHIQSRHIEEPGVADALTRMLISVGLLRPDGTPAAMPEMPEEEMPAAAEPAAESPGLWTPDSAQSGGGGGKLWTPE